jgi:hypothetical protein
MPYIPAGRRQVMALMATVVSGLVCSAPAVAKTDMAAIQSYLDSTNISASSCADPSFTQPFQSWGDSADYALAPGQSDSNFAGSGWYLATGAKIMSAPQASKGSKGNVLDMRSGALAISPPMCVAYNYPSARTMIRNVSGSGGVDAYVAYFDGSSYEVKDGGNTSGSGKNWALSGQISLQPSDTDGWQIARFALYASGSGEYQLYNFYVDPYAKR